MCCCCPADALLWHTSQGLCWLVVQQHSGLWRQADNTDVNKGMRGCVVDAHASLGEGGVSVVVPIVQLRGGRLDGIHVLVTNHRVTDRMMVPTADGFHRQFSLSVSLPPIMWGWAMTIHFAQCKTLDEMVVVNIRRSWDPGMAFVAMSRCRDLHRQLRIINLGADIIAEAANAHIFHVHPEVRKFYAALGFNYRLHQGGTDTSVIGRDGGCVSCAVAWRGPGFDRHER